MITKFFHNYERMLCDWPVMDQNPQLERAHRGLNKLTFYRVHICKVMECKVPL